MSAVSLNMAYGHQAWRDCPGRVLLLRIWGRAAMLSASLLLPSCGTLNRMDYLDQFFEPEAYAARHGAQLPPVARPAQPARPSQEPKTSVMPEQERPAPASPEPIPPAAPAGEAVHQASAVPEGDRNQWIRSTVRLHPWLALSWAQLTTAQQLRIERQIANAGTGRPTENNEAAAVWDTMGLDDRTDLAFGNPGAPRVAGAASNRDADYAARPR